MENVLQKIICRTCLTEASGYKLLSSKVDDDDRTLREILSNITNMEISVNDKYPKQVCDECHIMIVKADEFRKRCLQSETILKNGFLSHTFEELIKNEMITTEQIDFASTQIQNHLVNNAFFDGCVKKNHLETEIEHQLVENFYESTDSLRSELNYVKEEQDDFLQDDINDLTESIVIENPLVEYSQKLDLINTNASLCGLAIDVSNLHDHMSKCEKLVNKMDIDLSDNKNIEFACTKCNEEFTDLEHFKTHSLIHKEEDNQTNHQCTLCPRTFKCEISLNKHTKTHKQKAKVKQKKQLKNHSSNKSNGIKLSLVCPRCADKFPNMELFLQHIKVHKNETDQIKTDNEKQDFECSMCMRKFGRKESLVAHIKRHEANAHVKFSCKTCKREFRHKAHLENHIILVHSKEKGFTCDICSMSFATKDTLNSHKEEHPIDRKHECNICGKSFPLMSRLAEHIKIHSGVKPYLCSECGRGFSQKNNMMQHMRRHQGLKPFKCETCERGFVSKGELEAHNRKHSGAHPFVCDDCGGSFTTSSSLTKHRRIHTGERPYPCDLCTMRFTALNTLKNHRRTHTGEKPYQCSYCEKAFTQRTDLVSHIRCHTGERPYVCTSCGQAFRKASALKVHIKVHGKEHMIV